MKLRHERGARTAVTVAALLLALPASAAAQSDSVAGATPFSFQAGAAASNVGATVEAGEPAPCADVGATLWWRFDGTGGDIELSTAGSDFDTVLAVYRNTGGFGTNVACNDDIDTAGGNLQSNVSFPSQQGVSYLVQVGGFQVATGNIALSGTASPGPPPPGNDNRAAAETVPAASPVERTNVGATNEAGEDLFCPIGFERPLGRTVWFRFNSPGAGRASFSAAGFDTVIQVYRAGEAAPTACADDSPSGALAARVDMDVAAGAYDIQIGGFDGAQGNFTYQADFIPAPPPPPPAPPAPPPVVTPGQDRVVRAPRQLAATALLRATPTGNGIRVRSLTVNAGRGARISVRCAPRRACPAQSRTARNVSFRAFRGRRLRAGTRIQIRITRRNAIGRYIEYRITRGNFRRQPDRCIPVGSTRPQRRCR